MDELLLKIERENYWVRYLHWVYNNVPNDRKPEIYYAKRYEEIFKEND